MKKIALMFSCCLLLAVACSDDDSGTPDPGKDSGTTPGQEGSVGPAQDKSTATPSDGSTIIPTGDGSEVKQDTGTIPATDGSIVPIKNDTGPAVPDDPTICKACTGNEDCPTSGEREYMCLEAHYEHSTGVKIDEKYCARYCDSTKTCPTNFSCQPVNDGTGTKIADLCIPQPHPVCAMLP